MKRSKKLKIAVFMGGPSQEHEVSLNTGKNVIKALDHKKYLVQPVVVSKTGRWLLSKSSKSFLSKPFYQDKTSIAPKPDVAFIAMHGTYGEDGTVQAILEGVKIPYTGSGVLASALGMDKPRASAVFREAGLLVPEFITLTNHRSRTSLKKFGWPLVVKPANHGSSVGVHIVKNKKELKVGAKDAFRYSKRVIIQKFIQGREITCGVLEDRRSRLFPLPPTEIRPKKGAFYNYKSKYNEGGSEHLVPPPDLSKKTIRTIQNAACRAHQVIGCSGMSRSDFILGKDRKLYILEINTIPGMTQTSLLPEAAKKAGIIFPKLLDMIIESALKKGVR